MKETLTELQVADESEIHFQQVKPGLLAKFESWGVSSDILRKIDEKLSKGFGDLSDDLETWVDCLLYGTSDSAAEVVQAMCGSFGLPDSTQAFFLPALRRRLEVLGATPTLLDAASASGRPRRSRRISWRGSRRSTMSACSPRCAKPPGRPP